MSKVGKLLERYWIIYYLVYVGLSTHYLRQIWNELPAGSLSDRVGQFIGSTGALSNAFGAAAGIAVFILILVEGTGRMVLLIPATIKKLKGEGRKEGRKENRERVNQAYKLFGVEIDGVLALPRTPEVEAFLNADADGKSA